MNLASQIGIFGLQWAVGTFLVGGILRGTLARGWMIGASFVPLQRMTLGRKALAILLAVSAAIALAGVTLLHLAT